MGAFVSRTTTLLPKPSSTVLTFVRFLPGMDEFVFRTVLRSRKPFLTEFTFVRFLAGRGCYIEEYQFV